MSTREPNLLLIGLRGSGKTTIAGALAERQGRAWLDLDDAVLARFRDCQTVSQVFERHGQSAFRVAETEALRRALDEQRGAIIALGGGTPTAPGARALLESARSAGEVVLVYLRCTPMELRERLGRSGLGADRPSLTGEDPLAEIERVFEQRDVLYRDLASETIEEQGGVEATLESLERWPEWWTPS